MTSTPLLKKSKVMDSHDCHYMNLNEMPDLIARVLMNDSRRANKHTHDASQKIADHQLTDSQH